MLKRVGDRVFADRDPAAVFYLGKVQEIRKEGDHYFLTLVLPFLQKNQLQLSQKGDELTVQAGPYKRKVLLPRTLLKRPVSEARFRGQKLVIRFWRKNRFKARSGGWER